MYPFTNDVMNVEISGKDLKAMMSHAADPKNGMLHVSKTAKFKHYSTKPLGQRIVEFDIKGKQVADNTFSTVALDSFIDKGRGGSGFIKRGELFKIDLQLIQDNQKRHNGELFKIKSAVVWWFLNPF